MPAHGTFPDEVLQLVTRAGGSWWLALVEGHPTAAEAAANDYTLSDIPPVEVPRDATAWADPVDGQVQHATGVTMPAAASTTAVSAWALFNDEACTDLALSRWFTSDRTVSAGQEVYLSPEVLTIEFTPVTFTL